MFNGSIEGQRTGEGQEGAVPLTREIGVHCTPPRAPRAVSAGGKWVSSASLVERTLRAKT